MFRVGFAYRFSGLFKVVGFVCASGSVLDHVGPVAVAKLISTNDPLTHEVQEPNAPLKRTSFHGRRAVLASSEMRARPCLSAQTNMQHIGIDRLEVFVPKTHIGGSLARIAPVAWSFADTVRPTTCASSMPAFTGGSHVDRPWSCHDCRS